MEISKELKDELFEMLSMTIAKKMDEIADLFPAPHYKFTLLIRYDSDKFDDADFLFSDDELVKVQAALTKMQQPDTNVVEVSQKLGIVTPPSSSTPPSTVH